MGNSKHGGPAFPIPLQPGQSFKEHGGEVDGMTLRDYFAAQAMTGIIAHPEKKGSASFFAENAYAIADAMLAERAK